MMRYLRGMVLLGVSATLWACNTEPDAIQGGDPVKIVATPQTMFIVQGETKTLLVRLVDQQGGALTEPITITNVGAGISVAADSAFRPIYNANGDLVYNEYSNELRLLISATGLAASSFTVEAGGLTNDVSVIVLPATVDPTLSNATPAAGELVTITAPAGFTFNDDTELTFEGGQPAQIVNRAADGTTIDFYPVPGNTGAMTITNLTPGYAPALSLPFESSVTYEVSDVSLISSDDPNTAPLLEIPAVADESVVFNDISYAVDQFYHFNIIEANTVLDITLDWGEAADQDFWMCNAACSNAGTPGGFGGATAGKPEHLVVTFADPGVYTLQTNLYSGSPPSFVKITVLRTVPE